VERKNCIDFVKSVASKRIFDQLKKLKSLENGTPILLIEGTVALINKFTKWSESSIVALINSIILDWKVPIFFASSKKYTVLFLYDLARRTEREKKEISLRFKPVQKTTEEKALYILEGLPGISGKRAKDLLNHFRSVESVFENLEHIDDVRGIGKKTKEEILEVVRWRKM